MPTIPNAKEKKLAKHLRERRAEPMSLLALYNELELLRVDLQKANERLIQLGTRLITEGLSTRKVDANDDIPF